MPNVENHKFEGHPMPNKDKYGIKMCPVKIDVWISASLFITCIPSEEIDFEIGYIFTTSGPHWPRPWIGLYGIPLCITHWTLLTYHLWFKSEKLLMDEWMGKHIWTSRLALSCGLGGVDLKTKIIISVEGTSCIIEIVVSQDAMTKNCSWQHKWSLQPRVI